MPEHIGLIPVSALYLKGQTVFLQSAHLILIYQIPLISQLDHRPPDARFSVAEFENAIILLLKYFSKLSLLLFPWCNYNTIRIIRVAEAVGKAVR